MRIEKRFRKLFLRDSNNNVVEEIPLTPAGKRLLGEYTSDFTNIKRFCRN